MDNENNNEKMSIKLNEDYYIGFDSMNIILYKHGIAGEKSKNAGKDTYSVIGYFSSIEHLASAVIKNNITSNADTIKSLEDIIKNNEKLKQSITEQISPIMPK